MFDAIIRRCNNVKNLDPNKILKIVCDRSDVKEIVTKLQKSQMFDDGVDSKNKTLGNYSEASVKIFGKSPGHIKVYDTGEFFDSIKVKSSEGEIIISANTIKVAWDGAVDLLDRWSELLGLNEKSLSELREFIRPIFIEQTREFIFA